MGRETESSDDSNLKNRIQTPDSCRKGKIHECQYYGCGTVFNRAWRLENHILSIHEGKKLFKCKVDGCDKSYTKNAHLKRHVFNRHDEHSFKTVFICPELDCQRHMSSDYNLRKHYNNVHSKLFSCTYCNNTFSKRRQLSAHIFTHTGVPPFRCDRCDIGCASEYELKRHQRGHKTHTCTVTGCNLTFDLWTQLRKHAKLEHPLQFACLKCNKVFKTKHNLKLHIEIHEDPDKREVLTCPYDNCSRFYFHKRNLTHHIQSSHLGKLLECKHPGCGRKLCTKQKLQDHMKLHNPYGPLPRRRNQQTKERKKRIDAGKHKRSAAVKLSGIVVPYEVEKQFLHGEDVNNTVMSDAIKVSSLEKQVTISYSDLNVRQINDKTKHLEETHSEPSSLVLFQESKKDKLSYFEKYNTISTSNTETLNEITEKHTNEPLLLLPDKSKNMNKRSSISKSIQPSSPTKNPMLNLCSLVENSKFLQLTNSSSFNYHAKNVIVSNLESDDIVQEVPDSLSSLQKSDNLLKKRKYPFETDSLVCKRRLVNSEKVPYEKTHANLSSEKDKSKFKFNKATSENPNELIKISERDEQIIERKSLCIDKTIIVEDVSQSKIFTPVNNSINYFGRKSEETHINNFVSTINKLDIGQRKIDTLEFILSQNIVQNTVAHSLAETDQSKCNSVNLSNSKQTITHYITGTNTNTSSNCKINCSPNVNKKATLKECSTSLKFRKSQRINKVIDDIVNACFMKKTNVENDKASINSKSNNLTNGTKEINNAKGELTGNINIDTVHETSNVSPERIFYNNEQQNGIITELVQNTKLANYFPLKSVCSQTKDNETSNTDIYSCSWIEKTKECLPLSNPLSLTCHSRDNIVFNLELNDSSKVVHNTLQGSFNKQFVNNKLPIETDLVECRRRLAESKETQCENTHGKVSSKQETSKIEFDKAALASIKCTHLPGDELFSTVNTQKSSQLENTSISSQEQPQTNKHLEIYMKERLNVLGHVSLHDKEIISRHEFKFDPSTKPTQEQGTSLSLNRNQVLVASTTKNVTHNLSPHNSFDIDNTLRVYTNKETSDCENIEKGGTFNKKINKEMETDMPNGNIPVGCGDTINKRKSRRNCLTNKVLNNILKDKQSDHKVLTNVKSQNIINKDSQKRNGGEFSEGYKVTVEESLKDYSLIVEESKNNIVIYEKLEKNILSDKNSKDCNKDKGSEGRIAVNELKEDIGVDHSEGKIAVDDPEENIVAKKELEKDILVDKRLRNKPTLYQNYDKQIEIKKSKCDIKTVGTSKNNILTQNIEKESKVNRDSENNFYLNRFNTGIEENHKKYNIDDNKYDHNIETNKKLLYNIEAHEESDGNAKIGEELDGYIEINESERDIDTRQESDMNAKITKDLESDIEIIQSEINTDLHQGSDVHAKIVKESEQAIEIKESERCSDLVKEAQECKEIDESEKDFNTYHSKNNILTQNIEKDSKVNRDSENNFYLNRFNTGIEENHQKYNIDDNKYDHNIEAHEESDGNAKIGEESDGYIEINESERDIDTRQESDMNAKITKDLESDIEIIQSEINTDLHQGSDVHAKIVKESEQAIEIKESERCSDLVKEAQECKEIDESEKDFNTYHSKNNILTQNIEKDSKVNRDSENNFYLNRFNTGIEENHKKYNIDDNKYDHNIETNKKLLYNIEAHEESDGNAKIGEELDGYIEINESERDIDTRQESDMNAKITKNLESNIEIIQSEINTDLHQGSYMHAKIVKELQQAIEIKESERCINLVKEAREYKEIDESEKDFNTYHESDANSEMSEKSEENNDTNESERDNDAHEESDEYIDVVGVEEEMVIKVNNTDKEYKAEEDSDEDSEIDIESKENSEINIDSEDDSELEEDSEENEIAEEYITFNGIEKTECNIKTGNSPKYNLIGDKMIESNKEHKMEIDVDLSDLNVEEIEGKEIIGEPQNKHMINIDAALLTGDIEVNEGLNENIEICEELEDVNEIKVESNENVEICEKDFEINEESDEYIDVGIEDEVNIIVEATEKDNKLEEESDDITVEEGSDYDAIEEDDDITEEEYGKHSKIEEETKINKCVEIESKDKNEADQLVKETETTNIIGNNHTTNFGCVFKEDELKEIFMINEQIKTQIGPGEELKNGIAFHKQDEIDTMKKNEDKKETTTKRIIKKGENKSKHVVFNLVPSFKEPNTDGYSSKLENKPCSCLLCKKSGVNDRAIFKKLDEMGITRSIKTLVGKVIKGKENIPIRRKVTVNPEKTLSSFPGTDEDKPGKMMEDGIQSTNVKKMEDISPTNLKNFIATMLRVMDNLFPLINERISENYEMETDENRTEETVKGMPEEIKSHIISADENKTSIQVKTASLSCDNVPLKDYTPVLACNETILESLVNLKLLSSRKESEDEDINVEVFCGDSDDEDVWECCDCGKSFRNRRRLEKHMFSHVYELHTQYNNKQYKDNVKHHDLVPNNKQIVKQFSKKNTCHSDFRQVFKSREKIEQEKLPNNEELHTHLICEQSFKQERDLENHSLDHTEVKPYKCLYCGKYFLQHSALVDHLALHNKQTQYYCAECGKEFSKELNLMRHKLIHTEKMSHGHRIQELYKCSICGENFKENRDLLIHETVHPNDQLLTCPICRQSFNSKVRFESHFVTHKKEKPFKCLTCGVSFMLNASLIRHSTIHNGQSYKCTDCGKLVRSKSALKRHIETHMPEKAFKCALCDLQFRTKENLLRHNSIHTNYRPFECADCGRCFRQKVNMKSHIVNEHINNIFYKCYECDKRFKSTLTLNRHMLIHDERNTLKCFECDKCFVYRCHFNRHMRMHTGEKPFKCLDCGKCFSLNSSLKYHKLKHTGERPYKCETCGFCFRASKELKGHLLIHTNERPFECPDCRFCFRRKTHLKKHSMLHDVERPCKCVDCGLSFNRQSLLRRHITMYHSDGHFLSQLHYFLNTEEANYNKLSISWVDLQTSVGSCVKQRLILRLKNKSDLNEVCKYYPVSKHTNCNLANKIQDISDQASYTVKEGIHRTRMQINSSSSELMSDNWVTKEVEGKHTNPCIVATKKLKAKGFPNKKKHANEKCENIQCSASSSILKCPTCCKVFKYKASLKKHVSMHSFNEFQDECEKDQNIVFKDFVVNNSIDRGSSGLKSMPMKSRHTLGVITLNEHKCLICGRCFKAKNVLQYHIQTHTEGRIYMCNECGKSFNVKSIWQSHIQTHTGGRIYTCNECGKIFNAKKVLEIHFQTHTGDRPYKCDKCEKTFGFKSHLKRHMLIHNRQKPYKCAECGYQFRVKWNLKVHIANHIGQKEKVWNCPECDESFESFTCLTSHKALNKVKEPHKCVKCGHFFKSIGALLDHQSHVHVSRSFHCSICDKSFKIKYHLNRHLLLHSKKKLLS